MDDVCVTHSSCHLPTCRTVIKTVNMLVALLVCLKSWSFVDFLRPYFISDYNKL